MAQIENTSSGYYWIKKRGGKDEWIPACYHTNINGSSHYFTDTSGTIIEMGDVLLIIPTIFPSQTEATLRDQFAMAALTGLLGGKKISVDDVVPVAWIFADAMMAARIAGGNK